ncbi:chemotaxis protein CheW [Acidihalobacter ferrooxydans]|uniref:CheW-like domain-containing protein n=1 Tax=Acidihalobacter ferrooxydans TaxID=1765967 RepID=A0A1P8UK90_9GAMM|nr:chemotaxis protein CheW [Acidihalobacter ferrooxydans]APZ44214.1 hypothetical protein BW247_14885 [Acidihalobacter ferrooxydans]
MAISKLNTLIFNLASGLRVAMPQAGLAEVVLQQTMTPAEGDDEPWLLGFLEWRGEQVPVVDPGVICGHPVPTGDAIHRFGVLYGLEHIVGLDYYAFALDGVPHPARVGPDDVLPDTRSETDTCPAVAAAVSIEDQPAVIPDFPFIEHLLEKRLAHL